MHSDLLRTNHAAGDELVAFVLGQAVRLNVTNVATVASNARLELLNFKGIIINDRPANMGPGVSQSMKFAPRGATMVRPRVVSLKGSCSAMMVSLEIVDVATGRTELLVTIDNPLG